MLAIQILGINGHTTTTTLKDNTVKALRDLGVEAKVEEVSDIDRLINYDISGVPAMVIDGQLRFQQSIPNVEDLKLLIKVLTKPTQRKRTMKNILIPTDFSETAADAFRYAQLYISEDAHFTVLHAYPPQVDAVYPYIGTISEGFFKEKKANLKNWTKEKRLMPEGNVLVKKSIDSVVEIATPTYAIAEQSKAYDLIIMGGTGDANLLEKAFGSTATYVARNAHCPVLMIPKNYPFNGYKKILYASNVEDFDEAMLQQLVDFTWDYNPEISLVHINEKKEEDYEIVSEDYEQFFREKTPYLGVKFVKINSKQIIKGLQQYAQENDIDLIVMATKHRSWLEDVFHKSMTKKMILNAKIPVLVLHPDDVMID